MSEWKGYIKTQVQEMRPAGKSEDFSVISLSKGDRLEEGGMIARNSENHHDLWYVSKDFFEKNYQEVQPSETAESPQPDRELTFEERVVAERNELSDKALKLGEFIKSNSVYEELSDGERGRLTNQLLIMGQYLEILEARISNFPIKPEKSVPLNEDGSDPTKNTEES